MDVLITVATGLALAVLLAPLGIMIFTVLVLVPLAHLQAPPPMLGRTSFACPVSKREVSATFATAPGFLHPYDVVRCSVFGDGRVGCKKGCLEFAETHAAPSPMLARYALLAGGEALLSEPAAVAADKAHA